jgi:hypothetical protein
VLRFRLIPAFGILMILAALPAVAQTLASDVDATPPQGAGYVLGIGVFPDSNEEDVALVTVAQTYFFNPPPAPTVLEAYDITNVVANPSTSSVIAVNEAYVNQPNNGEQMLYVTFAAFQNSVTGLTFIPDGLPQSQLFPLRDLAGDPLPTAIVTNASGQLYVATNFGINLYSSLCAGTASLTFANSGPGMVTDGSALAIGPNNNVYVMDAANSRIAIYSSTGVYQGSIALSGTTAATALAVSNSGLVFTANGDGGGNIYSSSGSLIGELTSTPDNQYGIVGNTSLALQNDSVLYLFDQTTGAHEFDIAAIPEPRSAAFLAGVGALLVALIRVRSLRHTSLSQVA